VEGPVWVTSTRSARLMGTVEVPQQAEGIAAVPKTSGQCQIETFFAYDDEVLPKAVTPEDG
jgi:hypothetical protein